MIAERVQNTPSKLGLNDIGLLDDSLRSSGKNPPRAEEILGQVAVEVTDPLETLMSEIRSDATADPVQYLLRSNTSHDGE